MVVAAPKPDDLEDLLERRGIFYPLPEGVGDFARFYLGQRPSVTKDWVVDDAVITEFKKYLADQRIRVTDQQIEQNLPWLKWEIKREVFTTLFGLNEGYKVELDNDPQLDKAEESIPQAKALYANARKIVAERQSSSQQP